MNPALQSLQSLRQFPARLREHPMFHDPISIAAFSASVIFNLITLAVLVLKVHQVNYPVPVHYLSLVGFDQVGSWYQTYRIAVFGFVVTAVNAFLAAKSYQRNRLVSFFLLLGSAAVGLLCIVIGRAFAVIV